MLDFWTPEEWNYRQEYARLSEELPNEEFEEVRVPGAFLEIRGLHVPVTSRIATAARDIEAESQAGNTDRLERLRAFIVGRVARCGSERNMGVRNMAGEFSEGLQCSSLGPVALEQALRRVMTEEPPQAV